LHSSGAYMQLQPTLSLNFFNTPLLFSSHKLSSK
jgi:hypothetical protein